MLRSLRALPFPEQLAAIDTLLDGPAELIAELASYRDYQPLAYAIGRLAETRSLEVPGLAKTLMALPDTGLRRVLRALANVAHDAGFEEFLAALAEEAWALPIERIAAVAMVERWLGNVAPSQRATRADDALRRCTRSLRHGSPEDISDCDLMRLSGSALQDLQALALPAETTAAWNARYASFAARALDVLEAQPKSLSQANAEELLARQVYTDPGHFLIELLQNADDAGATFFRAHVFEDRLEITHNGAPFGALDVVGVLSIGQTTKSKEQIGFFGVGFKSVYEICERPQVYSGAFSFEIADVSIPRPLANNPTLAIAETRLVLPFRAALQEEYGPKAMFRSLCALPSEVVLTLSAVRELDVQYGEERRHVQGRATEDGHVVVSDNRRETRYLVLHTEAAYENYRDHNRATQTPVLVAITLDSEGLPTPRQSDDTIYSYLPTREHSGLRFLVHAHFDLPVDRERIDTSSPWNCWALDQAGELLRDAALQYAEHPDPRYLRAFLSIISLPEELGHPVFGRLAAPLRDRPLLRGAHGELCRGNESLLCDDAALRNAFAGCALQDGRFLLAECKPREARIATWLGAQPLRGSALVQCIGDDARSRTVGAPFDAPWSEHLSAVADTLAKEPSLRTLADLPCLPDQHNCAAPPSSLAHASAPLRSFLSPVRKLVRADLEECSGLLAALGVRRARVRDLVSLCKAPRAVEEIAGNAGHAELLRFLAEAPRSEREDIAEAAIVPLASGGLGTVAASWQTGRSALASYVRETWDALPATDLDVEDALASELALLGVRTLDVAALADLLHSGSLTAAPSVPLTVPPSTSLRLHLAIDDLADTLTPKISSKLASCSIFPTADGGVGPLLGPARVSLASDDELAELWPERTWLRSDIAALGYVRSIGGQVLGPSDFALHLCHAAPTDEERRRALRYLAERSAKISDSAREALARAPLWPDLHGALWPIDSLRRPASSPSVAALYARWPQARSVEADEGPGSALAVAHALGLAARIQPANHEVAIRDLALAFASASPYRAPEGIDLLASEMQETIADLLNSAAGVVTRTVLSAAMDMPIYPCADGVRRPLGEAKAPHPGRALRAAGALAEAFPALGLPVLSEAARQRYEPLLDALLLRPATILDLARVAANAAELAPSAELMRQALASACDTLAASDSEDRIVASSLALWPTESGELRPATDVVHPRAWNAFCEDAGLALPASALGAMAIVAPEAQGDAERVADVLSFRAPHAALLAYVAATAHPDRSLSEQSEIFSNPERVASIANALAPHHDRLWSVPVAVSATSHLVAKPLYRASSTEHAFLAGLPIESSLAHPDWASRLRNPDALEALSLRHILGALREVSSSPAPVAEHPVLAKLEPREAFYRWIAEHRDAIAADPECLGLLGKSAIALTSRGVLRSPRELLFEPDLPDLGIDWLPSEELGEPLCTWFEEQYRPASKQLRPLVEHMLSAVAEAADARDGDRLEALLEHLAKLLRAEREGSDTEELARRFKLRKHLRAETDAGDFDVARKLLAALPTHADLLERFCVTPPRCIARRYQSPGTRRLLRAAGADEELGLPALRAYLEGQSTRPGEDAGLALACYLAAAAVGRPSLKSELDLLQRAWVPNALGTPCPPRALYWPEAEVHELLGDVPHLVVHREFALRCPEAQDWLPLRTYESAALADVAAVLKTRAAGATALRWLDDGLAQGRIKPKAVHAALGEARFLEDDLGVLRSPSELLVSAGSLPVAGRRGTWSIGVTHRHLAKALQISRAPEARDAVNLLAEIQAEFDDAARAGEAFAGDRSTQRLLPALLDLLVERGAKGPKNIPVLVREEGALRIVVLPNSQLRVAVPGEGVPEALELVLELVLADGADPDAWRKYLRRYGAEEAKPSLEGRNQATPEPPLPPAAEDTRDEDTRDEDAQEERESGVLSRLRTWFRSDERDEEEPRAANPDAEPAKPPRRRRSRPANESQMATQRQRPQADASEAFRPVDQRAWFGSASPLTPQLHSNASWLANRGQAPTYGLSHAPHSLPLPHRYAPNAIYGSFERGRQSWSPMKSRPEYAEGGRPMGRLHLRGVLPSPEARVPMPPYARFAGHQGAARAKVVDAGGVAVLLSPEEHRSSLVIDLLEAPNFSEATRLAKGGALLEECVATSELPDEVLDLVESLRGEESALRVCNIVRSFVRKRYVYDPTYLEDPQMAAWLRERSEGRSNLHIAALHAGGDVRHLGRGVCFELGSLVCEILRRCGVAAGVATGWTFDRGHIDEPDHLWAMALLQTSAGPRWFPVDASTTEAGRPLHASHRPPGPWKADARKARALPEPDWDTQEALHRDVEAIPLGDLLRVARFLETKSGRHLGTRGELLAVCREALSSPERRDALVTLLTDSTRTEAADDGDESP